MRSILEQAVHFQLNGDHEKAAELIHEFIVAKARQIHESLRHGEDPLAEGFDDAVDADTYFTEEDLASLEDDSDDISDDAAMDDEENFDDDQAEMDDDINDTFDDENADLENTEDSVDDLSNELDAHEQDDMELADEVDELSAKLAELEAKFAEFAGDDDVTPTDSDDDFDRLGESFASDLEKVAALANTDGKEFGTGGTFAQNKKSPTTSRKVGDRQGGKPVAVKSTNHKSHDREASPSVETLKPRRNNVPKAVDAFKPVKK